MNNVTKVKAVVNHLSEYEVVLKEINGKATTTVTGNTRTTEIGPILIDNNLPNKKDYN